MSKKILFLKKYLYSSAMVRNLNLKSHLIATVFLLGIGIDSMEHLEVHDHHVEVHEDCIFLFNDIFEEPLEELEIVQVKILFSKELYKNSYHNFLANYYSRGPPS